MVFHGFENGEANVDQVIMESESDNGGNRPSEIEMRNTWMHSIQVAAVAVDVGISTKDTNSDGMEQ